MSREGPAVPPAPEGLVLAAGLRASRETFERWRRDPAAVLFPWFAGALAIAAALLTAVWVVSRSATPDLTQVFIPGYNDAATIGDYFAILGRNLLVLALHATACVAGVLTVTRQVPHTDS